MTKLARVVAIAGLALLGAMAVRAESEVTPCVGFQVGGSFDTRDGTSTERVALRAEGRGLLSFFSSSGAIFCGNPPGECGLAVSGSNFGQIDGQIGLTFRF